MLKYSVIDIPGKSKLRVASIDDKDGKLTQSPQWMIAIQNFCHSQIKGFENYTTLYGWQADCGRAVDSSEGPNMNGLDHSDVTCIIPVNNTMTEIETALYKGKMVDPVSLIKIGTIGYNKVKLQEITFTGCYITAMQQEFDKLILGMSICKKINTIHKYDSQGHALGQMISTIDFASGDEG